MRHRPRRLVDVPTTCAAAAQVVALVRTGKLMLTKGSLHTDVLMHEVVSPVAACGPDRRLSHVYLMDVPAIRDR